jgi:hypothetical protein
MVQVGGKMPRKTPMECWGCKGYNMYPYFPHRGDKVRSVHNVQQSEIVEDMGTRVPRIYATLENRQNDLQSHMIEVKGMINNHSFNILIHLGDSNRYIDPKVVEILQFPRSKHGKYWLVQLATGTKRKVVQLIKPCPVGMNGLSTKEDLNIFPLGSYD